MCYKEFREGVIGKHLFKDILHSSIYMHLNYQTIYGSAILEGGKFLKIVYVFFTIWLFSSFEKSTWPFISTNLNSILLKIFLLSRVEIGRVVLEKEIFKSRQCNFTVYLPIISLVKVCVPSFEQTCFVSGSNLVGMTQ